MSQMLREKPVDAEDDSQILDMIDRWVAHELKPIVKQYDHEDRYPHEVVEQMKDLGLFGATISPDYGGLGLPSPRLAGLGLEFRATQEGRLLHAMPCRSARI